MGYNTQYTLSVTTSDPSIDSVALMQVIPKLRDQYDDARYALLKNGDRNEECKWYDHEKDLRAYSKEYPTVLFELEGIGEEQPDLWHKYFKNGQMQLAKAIITYPPFDESQLR